MRDCGHTGQPFSPELSQATPYLSIQLRMKAILFACSTADGRHIGIEWARRAKEFDSKMGGKSSLLLMRDAKLKYAVDTACFGLLIHRARSISMTLTTVACGPE